MKKLLYRELQVITIGQAFTLPLIMFLANIISLIMLKSNHITIWDKNLGTDIIYHKISKKSWIIRIVVFIVLAISTIYCYIYLLPQLASYTIHVANLLIKQNT